MDTPTQSSAAPAQPDSNAEDLQALAKGGRTNTFGFVLRLAARIPFLLIATRLYGPDALGIFASAFVLIEILALVCSLGEKRGLAQRLTEGDDPPVNLVFDGLLLALIVSSLAALVLWLFPAPMFPNGMSSDLDIWMVVTIPAFALTEILLAAQAYRFDIATTVRARAVVEPWTISIMAGVFFYIPATQEAGLALAYICSIFAALFTAAWAFFRTYGLPQGWRPHPVYMAKMIARALPLVGADGIERGTRLLDIFILGFYASPAAVAIYYVAQQIATLPQKLKQSFEPVLSPVITKNLKIGNLTAIASQVRQVGFWIIAVQLGIALILAVPGEAVMGLWGPEYVGGTGALAILLAAEVIAAMAVVSESVLVYIARKRNLAISVGILALQGVLTVGLIMLASKLELGEPFKAAGAAMALFIALGVSSLIKALLLKKLLKAPVSNWRWALVWAAGPAVVVGFAATFLPEWAELLIGIPAILATYCWVIWNKGFGEEDRVLFRKNLGSSEGGSEGGQAS
ncbi:lipopolysaccharide biosynthesis protein [Pontixanthobacter aquaemixtae]|uniref:Lipopolysaccharide biosynthesis protein n=1 Tax=Pontixanthobacter aquaemixtae TaxID=1958940 RepID=A0A844ZVP3_9SPHN|nr:oligosaccharide flippase family protein [Pontixanthobacter aquaemixtae]MXO90827.1 lipopolysaccharide biosynthesis protein [Pontixanthobacter aquaemixtae]